MHCVGQVEKLVTVAFSKYPFPRTLLLMPTMATLSFSFPPTQPGFPTIGQIHTPCPQYLQAHLRRHAVGHRVIA
jgi:hypothetical protein